MNKQNYSDNEVLEKMTVIEPLGFRLDESKGYLDVIHDYADCRVKTHWDSSKFIYKVGGK
jgi:hypothetical protein